MQLNLSVCFAYKSRQYLFGRISFIFLIILELDFCKVMAKCSAFICTGAESTAAAKVPWKGDALYDALYRFRWKPHMTVFLKDRMVTMMPICVLAGQGRI